MHIINYLFDIMKFDLRKKHDFEVYSYIHLKEELRIIDAKAPRWVAELKERSDREYLRELDVTVMKLGEYIRWINRLIDELNKFKAGLEKFKSSGDR